MNFKIIKNIINAKDELLPMLKKKFEVTSYGLALFIGVCQTTASWGLVEFLIADPGMVKFQMLLSMIAW